MVFTRFSKVHICRWNHWLWNCMYRSCRNPFCAYKGGRYNCPDSVVSGCSARSSLQVTPFIFSKKQYADRVSVHLIQKVCILKPMLCSRVDDPICEVSLKSWLLAVDNVDHDYNGQSTFHGMGITCYVTLGPCLWNRLISCPSNKRKFKLRFANHARSQMIFCRSQTTRTFHKWSSWVAGVNNV